MEFSAILQLKSRWFIVSKNLSKMWIKKLKKVYER